MSTKPFGIEIREVGAMSTGRLPEVDEARRRRPSHKRSPSSVELSIREPGKPGSINKSEAAAMGGTINLQENGMFTQNPEIRPEWRAALNRLQNELDRFALTQPTSQTNPQANVDRMAESFQRIGLSESASQEAAKGRDTGRVFVDDFVLFTAEEAKRNAELLEESRNHTQQTQDRVYEEFRRMGYDESFARSAAKPRNGGY